MKKIMMTLAAVAVAATMNAQVWVGGEIGFNADKTTVKNNGVSNDVTTNNFTIAPEIGYNLNEKWAVAMKIGFVHSEDNGVIKSMIENAGFNVAGKAMTNAFSINPYARYTFFKAGNFSAFVDGGISYSTVHINNMSDVMNNINSFGVAINPGISYAVSEKVGLVAHLGDLSFNTSWTKAKNADIKVTDNKFNVSFWNAISFGAYYNF
jgi:outer membrane protein W